MEITAETLKTVSLDHHGVVAAVCKDLQLSDKIDSRIGTNDSRRKVSPGKAVVAMILNGLGFTNRRLYLSNQFFENKPVELLLDAPIEAKDITDSTLGHTLDEIAEYGSSKLFAEIAFEMALENDLLGVVNHIDTTSMSVEGEYNQEEPSAIKITHGYSKDHRPDLKQVVLSLVVNGPSSIPIFMEPLDGNSSDKKSFHETIKRVNAFKEQIDTNQSFKWVGDSALFSKEHLLKGNDYLWLTRVPESIKEAKLLTEKSEEEIVWKKLENGYQITSFSSEYGDIKQRWLLVYSEQAYKREQKTFEKKLLTLEKALEKAIWHLGLEEYGCENDAKRAFNQLEKSYPYHNISYDIHPIKRYENRGKPKATDERKIIGYQVKCAFTRDEEAIKRMLNKKGRFILATNDLDTESYSDEKMLTEYKEQQSVERGFKFLKDPWFMLDSIFLKSAKRIEALMMVMTLCLFVYNYSQFKIRTALREENKTLPNQLGKKVQNPTMRWIFQLMEGISIVRFYDANLKKPIKEMVANLNDIRKEIIMFFGKTACEMYGLIPKNKLQVLGT